VKIFLTTKDNIKIAADLCPAEGPDGLASSLPKGWLVLTHMMPATKESWRDFAMELQNFGYESIAIDLRGHGESEGGPNRFIGFSDAEHQKSILDLEAAVEYLTTSRKATRDKVVFVGASIGANLSLQYIAENPGFRTAILLSPGLNYRGIETEPLVKKLKAEQKALFVSAKDDGDNAEENQKLFDLVPAGVQKKIQIYETGGHGTDILASQLGLKNLIVEFIMK
jgi:alpha-beta hydrolase superfamily lysophospholipase